MAAIPRGSGGSTAIPRGGNGGTTALARNGLTGALAIPRPGADTLTNTYNVPGNVSLSPQVTAQIQALLPGILAGAPPDAHLNAHAATPGGGQHQGGVTEAYITAQLLKAGVPLQDGQHVLPNGQVRQDPSFWDKYGTMILSMAGVAGGGLLAGALMPGLSGAGAAANGVEWGGASQGLLGGSVSTGMPAALPGASAVGGVTGATGVGTGLLGPSAETASDVAGAASGAAGATTGGGGGGFLSTLGKLGTGVLGALGKVGGPLAVTAGSIENQRAAALAAAAKIQQQQDYLAQQRALLALKAPGMEAANSVRGDVLANSQDASFSGLPSYIHIPTMSGGLRPSMLSDNSRQLGGVMSRNALANQLSGNDVPALTPLPTSNGTDTLLQGLTLGGGFLNALSGLQGSSPSSSGGSSSPPSGGGYQGAGTSGFPGDGMSPINNPMPPVDPTQGIDPNDMAWWAQQAAGGFS